MTNNNQFKSALSKAQDVYLPQIVSTVEENDMQFTDYQKQCVMGGISQIHDLLKAAGKEFKDVEQSSMTDALTFTASLQLNPAASPAEIYYILRNKNTASYGQDANWVTIVEPGIEGDGNDALLARFGRDVQTVHKFWEVREQDKFSYPKFNGLEMTPPQWEPTGKGKVMKVVYPITKISGETEFIIAEREDVAVNLKAHIRNNLMNETFGIAENRYKANPKQKQEIDEKKRALLAQLESKDLEAILTDKKFAEHISPAWKDSAEQMIVRKMRNNIAKKYPKNFENAFVARSFSEADEEIKSVRRTVNENANQEVIDFDEPEESVVEGDFEDVIEEEPEVEKPVKEKAASNESNQKQEKLFRSLSDITDDSLAEMDPGY